MECRAREQTDDDNAKQQRASCAVVCILCTGYVQQKTPNERRQMDKSCPLGSLFSKEEKLYGKEKKASDGCRLVLLAEG